MRAAARFGTIVLPLVLLAAAAGPHAEEAKKPPDVVFSRTIGEEGAVVFRHDSHMTLGEAACAPCHPRPFSMLHPERATSHEEMNAGRSCGTCHDGKQAFAAADEKSCVACHTGRPKPAAPAGASPAAGRPRPEGSAQSSRVPGDILFSGNPNAPAPVRFRHASHRGGGIRCQDCHPALFERKAGGTVVADRAAFHADKCGSCHDGTKAFGVEDGDRCERCHAEGGGS